MADGVLLKKVRKPNMGLRTGGPKAQKMSDLVLSDRWRKFPLCWAGVFAVDFAMMTLRKKIARLPSQDEFRSLINVVTEVLQDLSAIRWEDGDGGDGFYGFFCRHHLSSMPKRVCHLCGDEENIISGNKLREILQKRVGQIFQAEEEEREEELCILSGEKKCHVTFKSDIGKRSANEDDFTVMAYLPFLLSSDVLRCLHDRPFFFHNKDDDEKKKRKKSRRREGGEEGDKGGEKKKEVKDKENKDKEDKDKEKDKEKKKKKKREKSISGFGGDGKAYPHMLCGVYDGHFGRQASEWVRILLHLLILSDPEFESNPKDSFIRAYTDIDFFINLQAESAGWAPGSTALTALFYDDKILLANVGDCQAVLCRNGIAIDLVSPHSPGRLDEKIRLLQAGVAVEFIGTWRVNGMLAVSRSIGDISYKDSVCPTPEISEVELHESDEFLLIASDGLWDVMTSQDAVEFVINKQKEGKRSKEICSLLVEKAIQLKSTDNVTVVLVGFR